MRILIVGSGAVGGYFGARLSAAGHEVTFLARGAHAAAIREHGLIVDSPEGRVIARGAVASRIEECAGLDAELALVAVKARDFEGIAPSVGAALSPQGVAIPLLNGLDSEEDLARIIGSERVIGGVAQIAAELIEPGRVLCRAGGALVLAPLAAVQSEAWPRVEKLSEVLAAAGFPCQAEPDLARMLWTKLLWNAPFNAVCALTRKPAGEVLASPMLESLVRQAMLEVVEVARAEGVSLSERTIEAMMAVTRSLYASSEPSMLQDVRRGRPTEADALQGAIVIRGERHGIPTPVHRVLYALVSATSP